MVENLTAMPEVEIVGCRFTLTPTRGLLLTTGRKALIADNTFLNIPMPSIYISDDCPQPFHQLRVTCDRHRSGE